MITRLLAKLIDIPSWFLNKLFDLVNEHNNRKRLEDDDGYWPFVPDEKVTCWRTSEGWCNTHRRWESNGSGTLNVDK